MPNDECFPVKLEPCDGRWPLKASTEREGTLTAESVLRRHEAKAPRAGFIVACPNRAAAYRVASYLTGVALELECA